MARYTDSVAVIPAEPGWYFGNPTGFFIPIVGWKVGTSVDHEDGSSEAEPAVPVIPTFRTEHLERDGVLYHRPSEKFYRLDGTAISRPIWFTYTMVTG